MTWVNRAQPVRQLAKGVITGAASVIVPLAGKFERYELYVSDIVPSAQADIQMTLSVDGGSTYLATGYVWGFISLANSSATPAPTGVGSNGNDTKTTLLQAVPANVLGTNLKIEFQVPGDFSNYRHMMWRGSFRNAAVNYVQVLGQVTLENLTAAITHVKLVPSTGSFGCRYVLNGFNG